MNRSSDGVGRTIVVAAIAGALFAAFLAVTPRLTASNQTPGSNQSPAAVTSPTTMPALAEPVVAVPVPDYQVTVTTAPVVVAGILPSVEEPVVPATDPGYDGTITLTVDARPAGTAHEAGVLVEGDELQWRFTITNASDVEVWGAYVFLELHGPAPCDAHHLEPGESTDCWIATTAVEGDHTAEAWATAWTTDRMVKDRIEYSFQVTA